MIINYRGYFLCELKGFYLGILLAFVTTLELQVRYCYLLWEVNYVDGFWLLVVLCIIRALLSILALGDILMAGWGLNHLW